MKKLTFEKTSPEGEKKCRRVYSWGGERLNEGQNKEFMEEGIRYDKVVTLQEFIRAREKVALPEDFLPRRENGNMLLTLNIYDQGRTQVRSFEDIVARVKSLQDEGVRMGDNVQVQIITSQIDGKEVAAVTIELEVLGYISPDPQYSGDDDEFVEFVASEYISKDQADAIREELQISEGRSMRPKLLEVDD